MHRKAFRVSKVASIVFVFCAASAISSPAQLLTTLHSFVGYPSDGASPYAGLVQASDGNFYGTTYAGGANNSTGCNASFVGCGTVFKITPSGTLATLYSFCSQSNCTDGANPAAELVQASDGNFYGTTFYGGANAYGTVFKMTPSGALTTLYRFCSQTNCSDGAYPRDGLVQGTDGNFYGTTDGGGANGEGTVFKITPSGTLITLHSFAGSDGRGSWAGLVQASDGNFYGTTPYGGTSDNGTIFKITASGALTTLYSFCSQSNCADGRMPLNGGLVQASDGNFYGTTYAGGTSDHGTIFKITASGALTTLYSFCSQSNCADGAFPLDGLVQASDGNFYGTTPYGGTSQNCGSYGCGTVFKITPSGMLTTLHSFDGGDGATPYARLIQANDGNFYGTTEEVGAFGNGTVFRLVLLRPCIVCPSLE